MDAAARFAAHIDPFVVYSSGLIYASVCTSLTNDEATERLNDEHPSGVSPWVIADESFADGTDNPTPCPTARGCRHILFNC